MKRKLIAAILAAQMVTALSPVCSIQRLNNAETVYAQTVTDSANTSASSRHISTSNLRETPESAFEWRGNAIVKYTGTARDVVIPKRATNISNKAFYHNFRIRSITITGNVRTIDSSAFEHCPSLVEVTLPDNLYGIERNAFSECTSLTRITIPSKVKKIGENAFRGCKKLKYCEIQSSNIVSAGSGIFTGCQWLMEVKLAEGMTRIPANLFANANYLHSIEIPSSVKVIEKMHFSNANL